MPKTAKMYRELAERMNKNYPTLFVAMGNECGISVIPLKGRMPNIALFIETVALLNQNVKITEIKESSVICVC